MGLNTNQFIAEYFRAVDEGWVTSFAPLLPVFKIGEEHMSTDLHYQMAPFFEFEQPRSVVYCCSRQVGKSLSLSAQAILRAHYYKGFHTLIIEPRADQLARYNATILRPLLKHSLIKSDMMSDQEVGKFYTKEFHSGSMIFLEYCYLNPDRVRGISSISCVAIDESLSANTLISTSYDGVTFSSKKVCEVKAGEYLHSFNNDGTVLNSIAAKDASYHGERLCFKVTLETGETIECTGDHSFPTSIGPVRLSEVINYEYAKQTGDFDGITEAAVTGYDARGWLNAGKQRSQADCMLPLKSRVVPAPIQPGEVRPVSRVRHQSTLQDQERGLRRMVECLEDAGPLSVSLYLHPNMPGRASQASEHGVALTADPRGDSVVDRGRRMSGQRTQDCEHIDSRVQPGGSGPAIYMANGQVWCGEQSVYGEQNEGRGSLHVPSAIHNCEGHNNPDTVDSTLHACTDGLQDKPYRTPLLNVRGRANQGSMGMRGCMQRGVRSHSQTRILRRKQRIHNGEVRGVAPCQPGTIQDNSQALLLQGPSVQQGNGKKACSSLPGTQQGPCKRTQTRQADIAKGRPGIRSKSTVGAQTVLCKIKEGPGTLQRSAGQGQRTQGPQSRGSAHKRVAQEQPRQSKRTECPVGPTQEREACQRPCRERKTAPYNECPAQAQNTGERANRPLQVLRGTPLQEDKHRLPGRGVSEVKVEGQPAALPCKEAGAGVTLSRISKIEVTAVQPVYDIEVVGTHNYILANNVQSLNCQDIDYDFLPILFETTSANRYFGFQQYTGTPKTSDGTLAVVWNDSSMAEWCIPCSHCRKKNIASIEQDLIKMLGKKTIICAKCGGTLDGRRGYYVHARPDLAATHAGYHFCQVTHPLHYGIKAKWQALLGKMEGPGSYSKAKFYNEVLGVPCDENVKLLSQADLISAAGKHKNDMAATIKLRNQYSGYVMGVDWSGGGDLSESYTALAVVGFRNGTDVVDNLYSERLPMGMSPEEESMYIMDQFRKFQCVYMAHDYGGAGYVRESLMRQAGLPDHQIIPYTYVSSTNKDVITYNPPTGNGTRFSYSIDKARSLAVMCAMLRAHKISLPFYDDESKIVLDDLLNLVEMPRELPRGGIMYLIGKAPKKSDDFAHALNYACSAIWHTRQSYPDMNTVKDKFTITEQQLALAAPTDPEKVVW